MLLRLKANNYGEYHKSCFVCDIFCEYVQNFCYSYIKPTRAVSIEQWGQHRVIKWIGPQVMWNSSPFYRYSTWCAHESVRVIQSRPKCNWIFPIYSNLIRVENQRTYIIYKYTHSTDVRSRPHKYTHTHKCVEMYITLCADKLMSFGPFVCSVHVWMWILRGRHKPGDVFSFVNFVSK